MQAISARDGITNRSGRLEYSRWSAYRARRHLHAADVCERRRVCWRKHDDRFARAGRLLRAGGEKLSHLGRRRRLAECIEPIGAMPVIIEDDVVVGGNCGIYEGTIVKRRAVLGTGTILNRSIPVYDLVRDAVYSASEEQPLVIPEGAVVVPGSRAVSHPAGVKWGLSFQTAVIVKYRDAKTGSRIRLEDILR